MRVICKELEPFVARDVKRQAGRRAEEQLAHYLKRKFDGDPEVRVFNNLRIEKDGDAAQIDHLVVHPYGFVVVESKSVHGTVFVNHRGEWFARRIRFQTRVMKLIKKYHRASGLLSLNFKDAGQVLKETELARVTEFLLKSHRLPTPNSGAATRRAISPKAAASATATACADSAGVGSLLSPRNCTGCGQAALEIRYPESERKPNGPGRDKGLPGYWTTLFTRAAVNDPAGSAAPSSWYGCNDAVFRSDRAPQPPGWLTLRG